MATRGGSDNDGLVFLGLLFGIGGILIAVDQQSKREREQAQHRQQIEMLRRELAQKESQLEALEAWLGPKNEQVRVLANEVLRLRALVAGSAQAA